MYLSEDSWTHVFFHDDRHNQKWRCRHQHLLFAVLDCFTDKNLIFA
jgi:hypothetical protein